MRLAERLPVDVEGGRATLRTRQWARLHTLPQHWVFGGRQRREGATHTHTHTCGVAEDWRADRDARLLTRRSYSTLLKTHSKAPNRFY